MPIKKRRRVRLNSSPAGRPGRHSLTPVKGKKKAATPIGLSKFTVTAVKKKPTSRGPSTVIKRKVKRKK